MYVCVCKAVTEREVYRAIDRGARSLRELRSELGVASQCGRCAHCARQCLREAESGTPMPLSPLQAAPITLALAEAA